MDATETPLLSLTAADLMSQEVQTISAEMSLRDAAALFAKRAIHGAPVVDSEGRCVGVLSVSDIARWVSNRDKPQVPLPQSCSFQGSCRTPGGHEITTCQLPEGVCAYQRLRELPDKRVALACIEPNAVLSDWQVVALESLPSDAVRDFMTTVVIAAPAEATVPELARLLLEHHVHRLMVLDAERRPVGIVSVNDLLQVIAHPELNCPNAA